MKHPQEKPGFCRFLGYIYNMNKYAGCFDKYKEHPDPNVRERACNWGIAIGLQAVDNLQVSDYLIELAELNINGKITKEEVQKRIHEHHTKGSVQQFDNTYKIIPDATFLKKTRNLIYNEVYKHPEFGVKDLSAALHLPPNTVRYHLKNLIADGWLCRKNDKWQALRALVY